MKHFYKITLCVLGYAALVTLFQAMKSRPPESTAASVVVASLPSDALRIFSSDPFYDRLIANRVNALTAMAQYRERMGRASKNMFVTRRHASAQAHAAWSEVIKTNLSQYSTLLEKAKTQPHGRTPCTICDGFSYMPCVMCKHHDGKCTTCGGSGWDVGNEYCPSCFGKGKCYLCNGSGKMFCPFCDDGMIRIDWSPPNAFPPLD